jgi:hypothetical protein
VLRIFLSKGLIRIHTKSHIPQAATKTQKTFSGQYSGMWLYVNRYRKSSGMENEV